MLTLLSVSVTQNQQRNCQRISKRYNPTGAPLCQAESNHRHMPTSSNLTNETTDLSPSPQDAVSVSLPSRYNCQRSSQANPPIPTQSRQKSQLDPSSSEKSNHPVRFAFSGKENLSEPTEPGQVKKPSHTTNPLRWTGFYRTHPRGSSNFRRKYYALFHLKLTITA